ncbi:DedA family protein [Sinomonas sp. ASV322]|nr:DedA family protein [Sinomonas sp. ASV322]MDQ4503635.1 DedA family protein [Sinomonas sp. ASV322]
MEVIDHWILHAAGQWWIYPILLGFFFVDGFAMLVPSETLIVALAAYWRHTGQPNLWILGLTALAGAMAGDNMAYLLGRRIGTDRWKWMRRPRVQKVFGWARHELDKRGAVLIFTARYIPWGRVAVNYVAGSTRFRHRTFFWLDAFACVAWVGYSLGVGLLASSFPWLHKNPLLSVVVAVAFALVLGVVLDHSITVFHRWRDAKDAERAAVRAAVAHRAHLSQHPEEVEADDYAPHPRHEESSAGVHRGPSLELDRD